jgi:hypothetical protein
MTKEERDDLNKAINTAKLVAERLGRKRETTPLEHVGLCALTRAVELLAGKLDAPTETPASDQESTSQAELLFKAFMAESFPGRAMMPEFKRETEADQARWGRVAARYESTRQCVNHGAPKPTAEGVARAWFGYEDSSAGFTADAVSGSLSNAERVLRLFDSGQGAPQEASTNPTVAVSGELVERLAKTTITEWEFTPDYVQEHRRRIVRAILAELAKMPVELPTANKLLVMWFGEEDSGGGWIGNASQAATKLRRCLAPVLAAKDAEILRQQGVIRLQNKCAEDYVPRAQLVDMTRDWMAAQSALDVEKERHRKTTQELGAAHDRIAELEKRLAEQSAPVDANGKTPGQVVRAVFKSGPPAHDDAECASHWERAARAVLQAFGNGAEALRQVRDKIGARFTYLQQITMRGEAFAIIDEIAKVGETKDTIGTVFPHVCGVIVGSACAICGKSAHA